MNDGQVAGAPEPADLKRRAAFLRPKDCIKY